jgi:hypothetical protein
MGNIFYNPADLENRLMSEHIECLALTYLYEKTNPELAKKFKEYADQAETLLARVRLTTRQDSIVELQRDINAFMERRVHIDHQFVNKTEKQDTIAQLKEEMIQSLPSAITPLPVLPQVPDTKIKKFVRLKIEKEEESS